MVRENRKSEATCDLPRDDPVGWKMIQKVVCSSLGRTKKVWVLWVIIHYPEVWWEWGRIIWLRHWLFANPYIAHAWPLLQVLLIDCSWMTYSQDRINKTNLQLAYPCEVLFLITIPVVELYSTTCQVEPATIHKAKNTKNSIPLPTIFPEVVDHSGGGMSVCYVFQCLVSG